MKTFDSEILSKYFPAASLDDEEFCKLAGEVQGEFSAIHHFREGNARTIKLVTDLMATQTGRPVLRYDQSEEGQSAYISAARAALSNKDYAQMAAVIRDSLRRAMAD